MTDMTDLQRLHLDNALVADRERRAQTRGRDLGGQALAEWAPQVDALVAVTAERAALRQVLRSIAAHYNAASGARARNHLVLLAGRLVDEGPGPRMVVDGERASVVDVVAVAEDE